MLKKITLALVCVAALAATAASAGPGGYAFPTSAQSPAAQMSFTSGQVDLGPPYQCGLQRWDFNRSTCVTRNDSIQVAATSWVYANNAPGTILPLAQLMSRSVAYRVTIYSYEGKVLNSYDYRNMYPSCNYQQEAAAMGYHHDFLQNFFLNALSGSGGYPVRAVLVISDRSTLAN